MDDSSMYDSIYLLAGGALFTGIYFIVCLIRFKRMERLIKKEREVFDEWAKTEPDIYKKRVASFDLHDRIDRLISRM